MRNRRLLALALIAGAVLTGARIAAPHAAEAAVHLRLKRSEPAKDSTIAKAPTALRLWFTEQAEPSVARVTLTGPDGKAVALSAVRRDQTATDTTLVVDVRGALNSGRYTVGWRVMSKDGHPVTGEFGFTIAPPTNPDD